MKKISIVLLCIFVGSSPLLGMESAAPQTQQPNALAYNPLTKPDQATSQQAPQKTYKQQLYDWIRDHPFVTIGSAAIIVALLKERILGSLRGSLIGFAAPETMDALPLFAEYLLELKREKTRGTSTPRQTNTPAVPPTSFSAGATIQDPSKTQNGV